MDIVLSTLCNLKCNHCFNMICKYKDPITYSADRIIESISKILPYIDSDVNLLGGETLLYKELDKVISYLNTTTLDDCKVYTNASYMPDNINEICNLLKDPRWTVFIEDYPRSIYKSDLIRLFKAHGIKYRVLESRWYDLKDCEDRYSNKIDSYCNFHTVTLVGNMLYSCERIANGYKLGFIDSLDPREYCNVDEEPEKLGDLYNTFFTESCKYCVVGSEELKLIDRGS